ncbi:MAG TPA: YcfL family protein [Verrucomicrobiae bacterium]|jgi:uncharacterized protein YcfL|nr:YcfL family protein [Verrucomicrobiae bacterium]
MKKYLFSIAAAATAAFAFIGCQSGGGGEAYTPVDATQHDVENYANLVLLSKGVQNSVTSSGLQQTSLPDGRLQVVANLRNREERRIQVQVQCEFKDSQGFTVDSTTWDTVILPELAQESVKFISANDKATRYTVRVREAH